MRPEYIISSNPIVVRNGIIVLSGYGISVSVEHGLLSLADGVGRDRRHGAFTRATSGVERLVVLGHAGTVSFEALRWLRDIGAAFVHIDADGSVVTASAAPGLDDARLRRSQALAATSRLGLDIVRDLLREKILRQRDVLEKHFPTYTCDSVIQESLIRIEAAGSSAELRNAEALAAAGYWGAWKSVALGFARRDAIRIRPHWTTFDARTSSLTQSPRKATTPANSILNYLYAILEMKARIACLELGLDPGMGLLHADQRSRDSLALDVMEPVRPLVDSYVLGILKTRVFSAKDFFETREGVCRLLPPLTHMIAEANSNWSQAVAPVVERVAIRLSGARKLPTLLTQSTRSAGRSAYRKCERSQRKEPILHPGCAECGGVVKELDNANCSKCGSAGRLKRLSELRSRQHQTLRIMRAEGRDPAHGGRAAVARGERNSAHFNAIATWKSQNSSADLDGIDFRRDILPHLTRVSLRVMSESTGLSSQYCSRIRQGRLEPHKRHWIGLMRMLTFASS
jgi:CRISPR-associated endonuclease Cas1